VEERKMMNLANDGIESLEAVMGEVDFLMVG